MKPFSLFRRGRSKNSRQVSWLVGWKHNLASINRQPSHLSDSGLNGG